ncbi:glycoside hydrolase [Zobellia galactanivorans]|uniref:glycoside hydrolase n=1 Tax=Zobellia galactanivorans (strain DSM 12802 / CCUG 47099 / CIP 106680 / NCIMB 13871 / Dsij) TaxID=63186 RepID=UPI001C07CADA|nr:glycoside hydrolase family 30 protein [Zobellia galactanivorans]MBU3024176.1 xylanase [Zobellia galactanivorans]
MGNLLLGMLVLGMCCNLAAQNSILKVDIDTDVEFQTIHNFAASDAWAAQFTGLWPDGKRRQMADWLFSTETDKTGSPKGIGLTAWRFNIGAGSFDQGDHSGIKDPWRRTEGFLQSNGSYDWQKQAGQQWFLKAAKERGVEQFIAFVNSPPIQLTKNGKGHSEDGLAANISHANYAAYANFLADVWLHFRDSVGVDFDYMSPFNEPQWEWKGGQEGSPWNNKELAAATRVIDSVFRAENIAAQLEITEAGAIDYLTGTKKKHNNRSDQIETFFSPSSPDYLRNLTTLAPKVAAHSYFTTWPVEKLKRERERIAEKLAKYPSLEYWMSEYCILENNEEIKGKGRGLGMQTALYVARLIHADLTIANASAWHWWLAMSPYDFKDGLIYHDKNTDDGAIYDSKLLWTLGNYSRFIRPEASRISVSYANRDATETLRNGVLVSAYKNKDGSIVVVAINQKEEAADLEFNSDFRFFARVMSYVTDAGQNLKSKVLGKPKKGIFTVGKKSITTFIFQSK